MGGLVNQIRHEIYHAPRANSMFFNRIGRERQDRKGVPPVSSQVAVQGVADIPACDDRSSLEYA